MKPYIHAKTSARKFGGHPDDYQKVHNFMDCSKQHEASMRHRAILHNSFGIYLAERLFGYPDHRIQQLANKYGWGEEEIAAIYSLIDDARSNDTSVITNSDGQKVSTRDIAEQHVLDDIGTIPSLSECLEGLPINDLIGARKRKILSITRLED